MESIFYFNGSVCCFCWLLYRILHFSPAAPALLPVGGVLYGVGASASVVQLGTAISDVVENNTYNNTEDISKYNNKYY